MSVKSVKVFFLGRPGSGKTTAARYITELAQRRGLETYRMKDYEILLDMFRQDQRENGQKFRAAAYDGFDVLDFSVTNEALKRLEKKVNAVSFQATSTVRGRLITIEFARDNYCEALSRFELEFLNGAYFFCVDAELNECIQRIHQRISTPPQPDYHYVSEHIMHTYYSQIDWEYLSQGLWHQYPDCKDVVAYNNVGSLQELREAASDFAERIFMREFFVDPVAPVNKQILPIRDVVGANK